MTGVTEHGICKINSSEIPLLGSLEVSDDEKFYQATLDIPTIIYLYNRKCSSPYLASS